MSEKHALSKGTGDQVLGKRSHSPSIEGSRLQGSALVPRDTQPPAMQAAMRAAERATRSTENVQGSESTDQLRSKAEAIVRSRSRLLNTAQIQASGEQIKQDLGTIHDFTADNETIKKAMRRLATLEDNNYKGIVNRAISLIKLNHDIQEFYESTSSPDSGERPHNMASGSQVTEGVAEAQSTQASDTWTLANYTSKIGTLHQVKHLTKADLKNADSLAHNQAFKTLSNMLDMRIGHREISSTENSNEFVREWDKLAKGGNALTKQRAFPNCQKADQWRMDWQMKRSFCSS